MRIALSRLAVIGAMAAVQSCGDQTAAPTAPSRTPVARDFGEMAATSPAAQRQDRRFRAFVALEGEAALRVLDGPRWRAVRRLPLPTGPHNVAASPDGRFVAITSPPADRVTIVRVEPLRIEARVRVAGAPHDVAFTDDGRIWLTAEDGRRLAKIDALTGRVVTSLATAGEPHDLVIDNRRRRMWVTINGSPRVDVRSTGTARLLRRPRISSGPHDVELAPDGRTLWFSSWSSGSLTVASARTGRVLGAISAGGEPHHFAFGLGSVWVSDNGSGRLLRVDRRRRRIRSAARVGSGPHHVAVAGSDVLVAVHGPGEAAIVGADGRVRRRVAVGAGPHGIAAVALP